MHTSGSDPGSFHLWSAFGKQSRDLGITEVQRRVIVRKELPLEFEGDGKQVSTPETVTTLLIGYTPT